MKRILQTAIGSAIACVLLVPTAAQAQEPSPDDEEETPTPPPPPKKKPKPAAAEEGSEKEDTKFDHDKVVGHLGFTYFDITDLPVANSVADTGMMGVAAQPTPGQITSSTVSAPIVGARYWAERNIGIDMGLGFGVTSGSQSGSNGGGAGQTASVDKLGTTGFALHGGVPIAFAYGRHYTFLLIPEVTLGFASATFKPPAPAGMGMMMPMVGPEQDLSGFLFVIGARVGAEIQFGFIGIPELALQATIGLAYRSSSFSWKSGSNSASDGTNTFGTNVVADPWAIFKDAISATYYF